MGIHETLKGSPWWAASYAVTSLRNHKVRNIGIALILAISISIPTTVFIWTGTGTSLAVDDYFENNPRIADFTINRLWLQVNNWLIEDVLLMIANRAMFD